MPSYPSGFYVYMLVDPKTGITFYVGKGQRDRAWHHARAVARGDLTGNPRKVAKIHEILTRGDEVEIQIVAEYDIENDALEHEFELVDSMPTLTNAVPGGGGGPGGRRLTEEEIRSRITARLARIKAQKEKIRRARHGKAVAEHAGTIKNGYLKLARNDSQAAEIDKWLRSRGALVRVRKVNGACREVMHDKSVKLLTSQESDRRSRADREAHMLETGKFTVAEQAKGRKYRLQSS